MFKIGFFMVTPWPANLNPSLGCTPAAVGSL